MQDGQPVAYGSRALTDCQQRYAQIEKELLAIVYGCEKFHQYVYGKDIQVESDHKPLESIFKKSLHQAPMRLQRMLLRLQRYSLKVNYKPGKELHIADTLSRAFLKESTEDLLEKELEVNMITPQLPMSEEKLKTFKEATEQDPELQRLKDRVQRGWPNERHAVHKDIQPYWTFKEEISYTEGLMFKGEKLIVPQQLRQEMLEKIHESHLGMVKCKERARDILYWPNMSKHIEEIVSKCAVCNEHQNSNSREPLLPHPVPDRPWEKVGTDLFHYNGADYVLCVDYFSKFPEIMKLKDTTSHSVIVAMKSMFARHGIPDVVISDNGPQYDCVEFKDFAESWEFRHVTSSPTHAQSNGQAERTIQTIKNLLKKSENEKGDPYVSFLEYRNTPLEGVGLSPAQLLMGRRLKGKIPMSTSLLIPKGSAQVKRQLRRRQEKQKLYFDRQTKTLPDLHAGEKIRMQRGATWQPAEVLHRHKQPRSFVVRTPDGRLYRRNRKHLRRTEEKTFPQADGQNNTGEMNDNNVERHTEQASANEQATAVQDSQSDNQVPGSFSYKTRSGRSVRLPARFRD
ncbi:uncharacterized protein K02A2.6 [Oryzias melastigma]|uniref:uncharacterized protein K02A2.6 n=1 Tax=Oryzias melastigma TaxID=30732 RepID=UPI000CF83AF7|nr:uncharacterized protein K02A2.6 [Oryzias melastigma]